MNELTIKDLNQIAQCIYDKKGFNILVLDVRGICSMTDYFVIAEGSVDRHVRAISQSIDGELSSKGTKVLHVEGLSQGDWVVLDYGDVVIHLFTPEMREKYAIEELWRVGKIVDVTIDTSKPEFQKQF